MASVNAHTKNVHTEHALNVTNWRKKKKKKKRENNTNNKRPTSEPQNANDAKMRQDQLKNKTMQL